MCVCVCVFEQFVYIFLLKGIFSLAGKVSIHVTRLQTLSMQDVDAGGPSCLCLTVFFSFLAETVTL